ncbi:MAG TPA: type II toxin-antitoxin system RelE/ParE family toxin [Terracidiphilus sp.]|jgi:hypothetical protein
MQVFLAKWMARFARREKISHASLCEAIARVERGLIDADLGGGLIKQRVARAGKGRSGGYRTILAYRRSGRAIFVFGFAKSRLENVGSDDLETLREIAAIWMPADQQKITRGIQSGELEEVAYENKKETKRSH